MLEHETTVMFVACVRLIALYVILHCVCSPSPTASEASEHDVPLTARVVAFTPHTVSDREAVS